jgi:hypothetical protein
MVLFLFFQRDAYLKGIGLRTRVITRPAAGTTLSRILNVPVSPLVKPGACLQCMGGTRYNAPPTTLALQGIYYRLGFALARSPRLHLRMGLPVNNVSDLMPGRPSL